MVFSVFRNLLRKYISIFSMVLVSIWICVGFIWTFGPNWV